MRRRTPCKLEFERVCRTESIFNRRGSHMHATAGSILGPTSAHGLPITPALGGLSSAHKLQPRAPLPFDAIDGSSDNSPKKQCHTGSRLPDTFKHAQPSPQSFVSGNQPVKTASQQQPAPNTPPPYHHRHIHRAPSNAPPALPHPRTPASQERPTLALLVPAVHNRFRRPLRALARLIDSFTGTSLPDPAIVTTLSKPHLPPRPPTPAPMPNVAIPSS